MVLFKKFRTELIARACRGDVVVEQMVERMVERMVEQMVEQTVKRIEQSQNFKKILGCVYNMRTAGLDSSE